LIVQLAIINQIYTPQYECFFLKNRLYTEGVLKNKSAVKYLLFILFLFQLELGVSQNAADLKNDTSSFPKLVDFFCRCSDELFGDKKEWSEVLPLSDFRVLSANTTIKTETGYFRSVRNEAFQKVEMLYRQKYPNLLMSEIDGKIHKDVIDSVLANCPAFKKLKVTSAYGLEENLLNIKKKFRPIGEFEIGDIIADKVKVGNIDSIVTDFEKTEVFQSNRTKFEELWVSLKPFNGHLGVSGSPINQEDNQRKYKFVLCNDNDRIARGGFILGFNSSDLWKKVVSIEFISKENLAKIKLDFPPPPPPPPPMKKN
jgi:hypothetical protein